MRDLGSNAGWGDGEWLVVEADESDRSFLALRPEIAVVTNIELDHHHTYASREELDEAFRAVRGAQQRATALDVVSVRCRRRTCALLRPGRAQPAQRRRRAARPAGSPAPTPQRCREALTSFVGAKRRFEELGMTAAGARVVDDYAHHPTEVAATIEAARSQAPARVVAVFQPHLFSRTQQLADEFGEALAGADRSFVLPVYPARERQEDFPGVTAELIAADAHPRTFEEAHERLMVELRAGDLCLVMGAGDVDRLGRMLVAGGEPRQ